MFKYTQDNVNQITNHSFFEDIVEWVNDNNVDGIFPQLKDNEVPIGLFVQQTPYLFGVDPSNLYAQYTIIFQLQYKKIKRRA